MLILPVLFLLTVVVNAIQITVPARGNECFYENVETGNKLTGTFEVISGGMFDIDATVFGPHGEARYSVQRQKQGSFTVIAEVPGDYRVCFSNRMSTMTDKVVGFSIHTGDKLYQDVAKQEHVSPLENEITQLADATNLIFDEQKYMWERERSSRDTNESTNFWVVAFCVMKLVALIGLAAFQSLSLKRFFESSNRV